uniref:Uncharacterized protein n=1 Tax=Tanacetum cinerariifolium TaxID=118510 RepID=A0A6L2L8N7_TANCI|nr:hypothetical protein [Tanacetum cinerariifolium]
MDDPNITMEEYNRLEEEKARRRAIVFNDTLTSDEEFLCEPTVPDKTKGKSIDTSEGTGLNPRVLDKSNGDSSESEYGSWGDKMKMLIISKVSKKNNVSTSGNKKKDAKPTKEAIQDICDNLDIKVRSRKKK